MIDHTTMPPEDDVVAEAFGDLREATQAGAPTFHSILRSRRPAPARPPWLSIAAALALMAGSTWWLAARPRYPSIPDEYNVARWEAPTDFLLDSHTRDWFGAVPVFGIPAPRPDQPSTTNDSSAERRIRS